eukprot:TRINITY_DN6356_c0_g1_i5.p2 TRINITY_DN6356_c0_g1~~TRINITY_DN6356_c0_g1_i5.p2  ORF type:complete len:111 (+),score=11.71 TRINITY_DN6356_c0_g1_i5:139-471(+)
MIRRPPRSTLSSSSAASDVYKRQVPLERCHADSAFAAELDLVRAVRQQSQAPRDREAYVLAHRWDRHRRNLKVHGEEATKDCASDTGPHHPETEPFKIPSAEVECYRRSF